MCLTFLFSMSLGIRSISKSPFIKILFLFSLSIFWRKVSKNSRFSEFEFGGRYHVEISIGLAFGFPISIHRASAFSRTNADLSIYGMLLRMYIATPPSPRSYFCHVFLGHVPEALPLNFFNVLSSLVSLIHDMSKLISFMRILSSSICFVRLVIFNCAIES